MLHRLGNDDEPALRELLARDPAESLFVQSVLEEHGMEGRP